MQNKVKQEVKITIDKYWDQEITKAQFKEQIQNILGQTEEYYRLFINEIIDAKDAEDLEYGLEILFFFEENNNMIDLIHTIILEPWHREYEELIHSLQNRKSPSSIPIIKEAMQQKYPYLESYGTGTRQFINQSGHALASIGTPQAIDTIVALSKSTDPVIKDEMLYRISRLEGKNDYHRNH
jgi:hypothetical protein